MNKEERKLADQNLQQLLPQAETVAGIMQAFITAYKLNTIVPDKITRAAIIQGLKKGLVVAGI